MDKEVVLRPGEERFFSVHCLVAFRDDKANFAQAFVKKHGDPGPFMVIKNQGFPPGHDLYQKNPQKITVAVNGEPVCLSGSLFVPY